MFIKDIDLTQNMDSVSHEYNYGIWRSKYTPPITMDLCVHIEITPEEWGKISEIKSGLETGQFTQILDMLVDYLYDLKKKADTERQHGEEVMQKLEEAEKKLCEN